MEAQIFLVALIFLLFFSPCSITSAAARPTPAGRPGTNTGGGDFLKTTCSKTTYPTLCFSSLSSYATAIKADPKPKELANTALTVSLTQARTTSTTMAQLCQSAPPLRPRESQAMKDCVDNMRASVDELRMSIVEMGRLNRGGDVKLHINNIQTWVSAALTDENTCLDGFAGKNMDGAVKNRVRGPILKATQLTSNALSLVNGVAQLL